MEEAEEVGWVERAKQAGNRHTQKLPCSIWAVPTCVRRYLAPDLNGRIGGRGRKNWRQMHHADEGAATPVATEGIRKLGEQGQASTRINYESLSTSTISTLLDPQEFPTSLSPLAYCYSFALPKTYNNTTGSLSLYTTSLLHSFSPTACVSGGPS